MKPMSEFDPSRSVMVHCRLNERDFRWDPEWQSNYAEWAMPSNEQGVIVWDALLLDGWYEPEAAPGPETRWDFLTPIPSRA